MSGRRLDNTADQAANAYDVESGAETEALLPTSRPVVDAPPKSARHHQSFKSSCTQHRFGALHISSAFALGILACLGGQYLLCGSSCFSRQNVVEAFSEAQVPMVAPTFVGSTEVHHFPPAKPTNAYPSLFPTNVGYPGYEGPPPTGTEAAVIATAPVYPIHDSHCSPQLMSPEVLNQEDDKKKAEGSGKKSFKLFQKWGNLSPWYSVERGRHGVDSSPDTPETCAITGLHFLHRHGARYPTAWASYGGPAKFGTKLHKDPASWNASGSLDFLNEWTYKLGEELLTPFGRQQLYDLGISIRMKYGFLLQNFTEQNTIPVFRTESQDRMLASAMNFAIGFFGYPFEGQYQQSITIEHQGFNNTLAPYKTCPNANMWRKSERGNWYVKNWAEIYLKNARKRIQKQLHGIDISIEDTYIMQQLCPYETVALGYSKFCELFTEEEWEGFNYALDLAFWYGSAFGSPVGRVQGIGWVQELVARLTHTPIAVHNSSTNATLNDNPITFPLGQSLYVDATHEVVVLNIITALNLTHFASQGPLPYTHIPHDRTFRVAELAPFATNVQFQLLECTSLPTGPQIRIIINDAVAPLDGIRGCPSSKDEAGKDGMCPVSTFVEAMKEIIGEVDWEWGCHGDWTVPPGDEWHTTTGDPPARP